MRKIILPHSTIYSKSRDKATWHATGLFDLELSKFLLQMEFMLSFGFPERSKSTLTSRDISYQTAHTKRLKHSAI